MICKSVTQHYHAQFTQCRYTCMHDCYIYSAHTTVKKGVRIKTLQILSTGFSETPWFIVFLSFKTCIQKINYVTMSMRVCSQPSEHTIWKFNSAWAAQSWIYYWVNTDSAAITFKFCEKNFKLMYVILELNAINSQGPNSNLELHQCILLQLFHRNLGIILLQYGNYHG